MPPDTPTPDSSVAVPTGTKPSTLAARRDEPSLTACLKHGTAVAHDGLHLLMGQCDPFASRDSYGRFLRVQYCFLDDVQHRVERGGWHGWLATLGRRSRLSSVREDLADLGVAMPATPAPPDAEAHEALGWLYVSEGSTMGAALLLREARERLGFDERHGARHLAADPDGRATGWRRFVAALDALPLTDPQRRAVERGAAQAFSRFAALLREHFANDDAATPAHQRSM